ncbi:ABC transporter substrate-binding protein [[Mycoplasma] gypis]|uniref:ABC transporter substrate-binding protein n=1 Tax=[Mycoplasma] gypis TaxID=92404 RepID=A0ABZ2RS02_9BACT|nr:ABC transporter substrate-binding protein [[Mycoplasma] gypis]MBN0919577.1 peptide ABC transporter substrate-binding protein [[Mycoplasma] gypis]
MNKKRFWNLLLLSPIVSLVAAVPFIAAACGHDGDKGEISRSYDLGLTSEPINNLNYVRYKSLDKILPSLVDAFVKEGPSKELKASAVHTNKFSMSVMKQTNTEEPSSNFDDTYKLIKEKLRAEEGYGEVSSGFWPLDEYQTLGALGRPSIGSDVTKSASIYAFRNPKNTNNYMAITGFVNEKTNQWSNGDYISAQDLRDYLEYVLDLNTGSQKLNNVEKFGIRGIQEFLDAQRDYAKKFNKNYKNPWGRRSYVDSEWVTENGKPRKLQNYDEYSWDSQVYDANNKPLDTKEVEAIKNAALKFGFYTGQVFLDFTNAEVSEFKKLPENFGINWLGNEEGVVESVSTGIVTEQWQKFSKEIEKSTQKVNSLLSGNVTEDVKEFLNRVKSLISSSRSYDKLNYLNELLNKFETKQKSSSSKDLKNFISEEENKFRSKEFLNLEQTVYSKQTKYKLGRNRQRIPYHPIEKNNIIDKYYKVNLVKNPFVNPYQFFKDQVEGEIKTLAYDENSFTMIFDENKTPNLIFLLNHVFPGLFPVNRQYIETVAGGIDKYGSDPKKFLTTGPFVIADNDIVLGPQGHITLTKNKDYYDAENTISNTIKILFSTDKTINATLFEDGFVSQAYIPANKINGYWSNKEYKEYLNKNNGYGTIAFGFNLDNETNAQSWLQDQDLRNAIYYAIDREKVLKSVGWDFSFPVNTWTAFGSYKTYDGKNIELFFDGKKTKAKNGKEFDIQNYDYFVHLSKSYKFEKTNRRDITFDPETAQFYIERFKQKHPDVKQINLTFLNNSTDEQKKAGQYLREILRRYSDGFINVEIKSLPENTFASFIEEGKYDIIYQNYDRFGGNSPSDYVQVFFKPDEIDSLSQRTIAFKNNPTGSFTYADYISNYVLEALQQQNPQATKEYFIAPYQDVINKLIEKVAKENNEDLQKLIDSNSSSEKSDFVKKYTDTIFNEIPAQNLEGKNPYTKLFVEHQIEYYLTNNVNIKVSRRNKLFNIYVRQMFSNVEIEQMTASVVERMFAEKGIETDKKHLYWEKFIDLSYQKPEEGISEYSSRLDAFFSGNFTNEDLKNGWHSEEQIFDFIALLEKVIRDAAPVISLMEVDTNWEITKVGGVSSLFRFNLQYAYDMTRPPKSDLPRKREG